MRFLFSTIAMRCLIALVSVTGAFFLCSCGSDPPVVAALPRPVYTIVVDAPQATVERRFSGQLQSAQGTKLAFESGGRVIAVDATAGKHHAAGHVLARVNNTTYQNQLRSAKARLDNAEKEMARVRRLYESENASKSSFDSAMAEEIAARADFKNAEKALDDCILRMPYAGVIGSVEIEPEQVVSAGQQVMTIQGQTGMEFAIGVPAERVDSIDVSMPGTITLGALPEEALKAKVTEIAPDVSANGTYEVTLRLGDRANSEFRLRAGMDGECALLFPSGRAEVIAIPATCVVGAPGTNFVWLVQGEASDALATVSQRTVETGALVGDGMIEIVGGELVPGLRLVSRGVNALDEGMEVRVQAP